MWLAVIIVESLFLLFLLWLFYTRFKGAEYSPTFSKNAGKMIELAGITKKDVVYDLGSGFGGLAIQASRKAKKAVGIEYDPARFFISKIRAKILGIRNVEFVRGNLFRQDISDANVILMFLKQKTNQELKEKLSRLKKGTRIVSYIWTFEGWKPVRQDKKLRVYLYVTGKSDK